jgi:hypothetical protein
MTSIKRTAVFSGKATDETVFFCGAFGVWLECFGTFGL